MRQNSFDNVSDGHEMTNCDKENDIIGNDSVSDVNGDSPVVSLDKIFMCIEVYVTLFIFVFIYLFVAVYERE